jgi:hypothetical protein
MLNLCQLTGEKRYCTTIAFFLYEIINMYEFNKQRK